MMLRSKKHRLGRKGWRVGTVKDFRGLSENEAASVERLCLRRSRQRKVDA
jgi:hypothetical protein